MRNRIFAIKVTDFVFFLFAYLKSVCEVNQVTQVTQVNQAIRPFNSLLSFNLPPSPT